MPSSRSPQQRAEPGGTARLPVLIPAQQIAARVAEMGAEIDRDLAGESVVLVGVLKGAAVFLADLARSVRSECTFDFVAVSSYRGETRSTGAVRLIKDVDGPLTGHNVILVEDILDTGMTLNYLKRHFEQHAPRTLRVAALLDKPERRMEPLDAEYVGFCIPNEFVVGYGMDFGERYRNLPEIAILATNTTKDER